MRKKNCFTTNRLELHDIQCYFFSYLFSLFLGRTLLYGLSESDHLLHGLEIPESAGLLELKVQLQTNPLFIF